MKVIICRGMMISSGDLRSDRARYIVVEQRWTKLCFLVVGSTTLVFASPLWLGFADYCMTRVVVTGTAIIIMMGKSHPRGVLMLAGPLGS